jgi:hypothetical protein
MAGAFGGNKGGTPDAPDFSKLAMVNQSGPMGGASWSTDPTTGQISSSSQFTGQANDAFQGLLGGMNSAAGMDPAAAGQAASDKMYGVLKGRLDPQWQQNQGAFGAQMANSGIEAGSDAYSNASRTFGQQQNDAYSQASGQAIGLGQQEQVQSRANAMQPFLQGQSMMGMLPKNDPNSPYKAGAAQYDAAKDRSSANQAKKGSTLGGLGDIAGLAIPGIGGLLGGGGGGSGTEPSMAPSMKLPWE